MPRQQPLSPVGGFGLPSIRPAASPVDTFTPANAGGGLAQLAGALGSLVPDLRSLGNEVDQRNAEFDSAQGEKWASDLANSKDAWAGAIQSGKIAPDQSPWFRIAAKQKLGQVAADHFNVDLQTSLAKLGDGATPEAFDAAVADARSGFLSSVAGQSAGDLSFMKGFNSIADQQIAGARRAFAVDRAKQFELQASAAYSNATHAMARNAIDAGKGTDDIASAINSEAAAWAGVNPNAKRPGQLTGTALSKLNADVVFSLMRSTKNVKLATDLAAKIKDGDGVLLDSPAFQAQLEEMSDHVTADARQQENDAEIQQQRAERDTTDSARETLYSRWQKGGAVDTTDVEAQLKSAGVRDPHATAISLLDKMPEMDPKNYVQFRSRVARGDYPAQAELDTAARGHRISAGQYSSLVSDIDEAKRAERSFALQGAATTEGIWSHPAVKAMEESIRAAAKSKAKVNPLTGAIISYTGFTDNDVQQAVNEGRMFMAQWISQNWSKYGSGNAAMAQATIAWRGFAADKGIISPDEAKLGAKVLPADPTLADDVQTNAAKQSSAQRTTTPPNPNAPAKSATNFTRAEIHQMRSDLASFVNMNNTQRAAWASEPRHRAILKQLGDPPLETLGTALADAEKQAR